MHCLRPAFRWYLWGGTNRIRIRPKQTFARHRQAEAKRVNQDAPFRNIQFVYGSFHCFGSSFDIIFYAIKYSSLLNDERG